MHSAILLTCIKLSSVLKTFVLSIFEWLLKICFTVPTKLFLLHGVLFWLYLDEYPHCLLRSGGEGKKKGEMSFAHSSF